MNFIEKCYNPAYSLLRVTAGLMFMFHGLQKIFGYMSEFQPELFTQLWIGGVIEITGGLLIAIGLFGRWAAFISSGTMAVAYVQFHWKLQADGNIFPAVNQGELALLYSVLFLYIAVKGSGRWSLDYYLRSKKSQKFTDGA